LSSAPKKLDEKDVALELQCDMRVVELLQICGSDMSETHTLEHFIYTQDRETAEAFLAEAKAAGYETDEPRFSNFQNNGKWLAMTFSPAKPQPDNITHETMFMRSLAAKHGAEYDGWGTLMMGDEVSLDGLEDA
jgi:regulator of ribonuclease activity B